MTTEKEFKGVCELLKHNLETWTRKIVKGYELATDTAHLPSVGLAFRNQQYDEGSDSSFQSYLSACSSIYSLDDSKHDFPPLADRPITQAWGSPLVPDTLNTTTATHSVSGISQDDFDRVTQENQKLTRKLEELTSKMDAWEKREVPPPEHRLDMQQIIAATTEAVLASMQRVTQKRQRDDHNQQEQQGGANNSIMQEDRDPGIANLDTSFDSALTLRECEYP
jgi:hypothetical protein